MAGSKKDRIIKVAGYAKKVVYNNNIEYRNFSPDLVGQQFATNFGTPLFTMGNFSITTNTDPSEHTVFKLGTYSKKLYKPVGNIACAPPQIYFENFSHSVYFYVALTQPI